STYVEEVPIDRSEGEVTRMLEALGRGDRQATGELLPLDYNELRRLAAQQLARESPGQTLQATALVHEAYLRLVGGDPDRNWNGRAHFLAAAAQAMRRILVEAARGRADAHAALAAVYSTYTEGFATPDLVEARALLEALA